MMAEHGCDFCGRSFDSEWGLGQHVGRYCDEVPESERESIASELMRGNSPFAGESHDEETKEQISETKTSQEQSDRWREAMQEQTGDQNPATREEVRQKISDAVSGESHPLYGTTRDPETVEKISRATTGREFSEEHLEKLSEAHSGAELSESHKRKISETLSNREYSEERIRKMMQREREFVPALGFGVDSEWEKEIAFYLEALDVPYQREPCFELSEGKHFPDFLIADCIVEIKGWERFADEEKISECIERYPDITYVVVGADVKSDVRIPWEQRDGLFELLEPRVRERQCGEDR